MLLEDHQMTLALNAGNPEPWRRDHMNSRWKRCDLGFRIPALHGEQMSSWGDEVRRHFYELRQLRYRAGDGRRERPIGYIGFRTRAYHYCICQFQLCGGLPQECGFLLVAVEKRDVPIRLGDRQGNTRQPAPAADVDQAHC